MNELERSVISGEAASLSMSHNSTDSPELPFRLEGSYLKTKRAIEINAERLIREDGLETVLFGTLTVGDEHPDIGWSQCWDHKEGSRRFNSLATHLLRQVFHRWIVVTERHKNGAIHFHLIGSVRGRRNVRGGFKHEAVKRGDYRSVNPKLKALWRLMRTRLPGYGFGRAQFTPIKKTGKAVACYVAKYVEKNIFNRLKEDRRKRLVRYGGFRKSHCRSCDIGWVGVKAAEWRRKAREIGGMMEVTEPAGMKQFLGGKWAWRTSKIMAAVAHLDDPIYMGRWNQDQQRLAAHWLEVHLQSEIEIRGTTFEDRPLTESEAALLAEDLGELEAWCEYEGRAA